MPRRGLNARRTDQQGPGNGHRWGTRSSGSDREDVAARVRSRPIVRERTKRTFAFPKFPARVLALAAPVVLLGGGVAAGTDSLPPSAQAAVSRALSSLGIWVPKGRKDNHGIAGSPPSNTGRTAAIDTGSVAGPRSQATVGLCRAWMERVLDDNGTAYRNLAAAAGGAGRLPAYCAGAPVSSVADGATGRAQNPSFTQRDGRKGVARPSTTGIKKTVARSRREGIAIRQSGAVAPGRAAASTSTPPTTWRHGPKAAGSFAASGGVNWASHGFRGTSGTAGNPQGDDLRSIPRPPSESESRPGETTGLQIVDRGKVEHDLAGMDVSGFVVAAGGPRPVSSQSDRASGATAGVHRLRSTRAGDPRLIVTVTPQRLPHRKATRRLPDQGDTVLDPRVGSIRWVPNHAP